MGSGIHGGFGGTAGRRNLYRGKTKSDALKTVDSLPKPIQKSAKSFFKGSSNNYNSYSVTDNGDGTYKISMENPGRVPGSKAIYYKIIDYFGNTIRVYKETYAPDGSLIHTKEKYYE